MATTPTGITVPAGTDPFDPDGDMRDLAGSLEGRIIVPVANKDERAAVAAAVSPTAAEPLLTWRTDAPAGARLETTEDGATWRTIAAQTAPIDLPLLTGWSAYSPFAVPRLQVAGNRVTLIGGMVGRSAAANLTALQEYQLAGPGAVPVGMLPPAAENRGGGWLQNGTAVTNAQVRIQTDGSVTYIPISAISLTVGGIRGYLLVPDISWTRA